MLLLEKKRAVRWNVIGGSIIALLGVALISGMMSGAPALKLAGTLEVLAGAFSWSCYTVLAGRLNQRHGTLKVTGAILVVGTAVLLALSAPMIDSGMLPDRTTTAMLGVMGICSSLIGFVLWNYAGTLLRAERLGLFLYVIPLASVFAGAQLLAESLTAKMLIGAALVVSGVWTASRRGPPPPVTIAATE